jgi:hypothetical protein
MICFITPILSFGFKLNLLSEDTLRRAAFWATVLKAMFIIPVAEETSRVEVMVAICPVSFISLRSRD